MNKYDQRLIKIYEEQARTATIDKIYLGLGYSAVTLKDGRCGLCCTLLDSTKGCCINKISEDFENKNAYELLKSFQQSDDLLLRVMTIALINALNDSKNLKEDTGNLFDDLKIHKKSKVAMIGYFAPIVKQLENNDIEIITYDIGKKIGNEKDFYNFLLNKSDCLILTATSFINNTFNKIMENLKSYKKPIAIIGPSTIMNEKLYEGTNVRILGGTKVEDREKVLKSIRNGKGTSQIHKNSKKVYIKIN